MSTCCASLPAASCCDSSDSHPGSSANATLWLRLGLAGLVSAQTMAFSLAVNLSPPSGPARSWIHGILATSVLLVFILVGQPLVRESWRLFKNRRMGLEQMFLLGIAGAFLASLHSTLSGRGPIFYEVVTILLAIYTFGTLLSQRRRESAIQSADALRREFEFCTQLLPAGGTTRLRVREAGTGMRLQVLAGEGIPVDGIIESGTAYIQETPLTGEPYPVVKGPGDNVLAGSRVLDQTLIITVLSQGENRQLDTLLLSLNEARQNPSILQREADRLVSWFLPAVLAISLLTFTAWTLQAGWLTGMFNALAVLVVACPCAMGLATPIGIWSALDALARRGLVARSGDFIERLAKVDRVVFDKTGTLTEENLTVAGLYCSGGIKQEELQTALAAIQRESNHPVARAFHLWLTPEAETYRIEKFELLPGIGIGAILRGAKGQVERFEVGNENILNAEDRILLPEILAEANKDAAGFRDFYIKKNGICVAMVSLRERLRDSASSCIARLRDLGLEVEIMTGDTALGTAAAGLTQAHTQLLPEDKTNLLRKRSASGDRVLFVGDGMNDSGALSQAYASIALASGATLSNEIAQASLFGNNLETICDSIILSRQVLSGIRRNLYFAVTYNLVGIGLAAAGLVHPVLAAFLMLSSSSLVTWRALRFAEKLRQSSNVFLPEPRSRRKVNRARSRTYFLFALGIALQGPLLAYLGALSPALTVLLSLAAALLGCGILSWLPRLLESPSLKLVIGMLAFGNLGMLLGWSAHAGFGAIIRDGVCLCGCAKSALGSGLLGPTWMQAGMLLFSLPVFFLTGPFPGALPFTRKPVFFTGHLAVCLFGMLAGMEFSGWVMSLFPVLRIQAQAQFFLTFFAMTCGMVLGMVAACRLYLQWLKHI